MIAAIYAPQATDQAGSDGKSELVERLGLTPDVPLHCRIMFAGRLQFQWNADPHWQNAHKRTGERGGSNGSPR